MSLLAVFVLTLSLSWSVVTSAPTRCCMSHQFEAYMSEPRSINMGYYTTSVMFYDFDAKMAAVQSFRFQPGGVSIPTTRLVQDFNQKKWYTIQPDGSCSVHDVSVDMFPRCVPDSALYLGTSYLGRPDNSRLFYDAWQIPLTGANATITVTLFQDGCVPNVVAMNGDLGGVLVDSVYIYSTYKDGISDSSIFKLPSTCPSVPSSTIG